MAGNGHIISFDNGNMLTQGNCSFSTSQWMKQRVCYAPEQFFLIQITRYYSGTVRHCCAPVEGIQRNVLLVPQEAVTRNASGKATTLILDPGKHCPVVVKLLPLKAIGDKVAGDFGLHRR